MSEQASLKLKENIDTAEDRYHDAEASKLEADERYELCFATEAIATIHITFLYVITKCALYSYMIYVTGILFCC